MYCTVGHSYEWLVLHTTSLLQRTCMYGRSLCAQIVCCDYIVQAAILSCGSVHNGGWTLDRFDNWCNIHTTYSCLVNTNNSEKRKSHFHLFYILPGLKKTAWYTRQQPMQIQVSKQRFHISLNSWMKLVITNKQLIYVKAVQTCP